tara:strand:+ start:694 stop:1158 length:465 start_codon:yes stop_codon:yes gene_type:complete
MNKLKINIFYLLIFISISINAFSQESKKNYLNIESDQLVNKQSSLISKFVGNVYASDQINHFWGDIMIIEYDENKKIKMVILKNNVRIERLNEKATGNFASYNPKTELIEITGNVAISKNGNVLTGEKLTMDLISSTSIIVGNKDKQVSAKISN